jgi:hypothetical protein
MPSLIESLVEAPVVRNDDKRFSAIVRPAPVRPRDVFEVFGALGVTASFAAVVRSLDFRQSSPSILANAVLGRWLTTAELAAISAPYHARMHFREMMLTPEFQTNLNRRVYDAFPEKRRLLHVRIPSCAGRYTQTLFEASMPTLELRPDAALIKMDELAKYLGVLCTRLNVARAIAMTVPRLALVLEPPAVQPPAQDSIGWFNNPPPFRASDMVFAVLRSPVALALSQVNATLTELRAGQPRQGLQAIGRKLGKLPDDPRSADWKRLGRVLLTHHLPQNPVCHVLGDGTAESAIASCARLPIQLVAIERYTEWCRSNLEATPFDPIAVSEPFLQQGDLTAQDTQAIESRMAEDTLFYNRFRSRWEAAGVPAIAGPSLAA